MPQFWYLVPKSSVKKEAEIGSYIEAEGITDFSRGVYLAYRDKGLVTGLKTKREAERWRDEGIYDEKADVWTVIPPHEPEPPKGKGK